MGHAGAHGDVRVLAHVIGTLFKESTRPYDVMEPNIRMLVISQTGIGAPRVPRLGGRGIGPLPGGHNERLTRSSPLDSF